MSGFETLLILLLTGILFALVCIIAALDDCRDWLGRIADTLTSEEVNDQN